MSPVVQVDLDGTAYDCCDTNQIFTGQNHGVAIDGDDRMFGC